jgi:hypothetical protein
VTIAKGSIWPVQQRELPSVRKDIQRVEVPVNEYRIFSTDNGCILVDPSKWAVKVGQVEPRYLIPRFRK